MDPSRRTQILELEARRRSRFMRERLERAKSEADAELRAQRALQKAPPLRGQFYREGQKYEVALCEVAHEFAAIRRELAATDADLLSEPELKGWLANVNETLEHWVVARTEEFARRLHAAGETKTSFPAPKDPSLEGAANRARNALAEEFHEMRLSSSLGITEKSPNHAVLSDRRFAQLAIGEARESVSENDGRPHPKVGVVVVKDGQVLGMAHRGETPKCHAEYIALEEKLGAEVLAGATVYTTLEPCTTRNHPKIPCATRLVERKVARVVIGMLDPNPAIMGRGQTQLFEAGIVTDFFPFDLMREVAELNREFKRAQDGHRGPGAAEAGKWVAAYAEQRKQVPETDILKKIWSKPHWRIWTRPPEFKVARFQNLDECQQFLKALTLSATARFPYPWLANGSENDEEWIAGETDAPDGGLADAERWALFRSGQLVQNRALGQNLQLGGRVHVLHVLSTTTATLKVAAQMARRRVLFPDAVVTFEIRGVDGVALTWPQGFRDDSNKVGRGCWCQDKEITVERRVGVELETAWCEIALDVALEIYSKFGWSDPPRELLAQEQQVRFGGVL